MVADFVVGEITYGKSWEIEICLILAHYRGKTVYYLDRELTDWCWGGFVFYLTFIGLHVTLSG